MYYTYIMAQEGKDTKDIKGLDKEVKDIEPLLVYQLTDRLRDEFKEFTHIRVYGTEKNPLFPAADVAKAIGKRQFRLEEHPSLVVEKHYQKRVIPGIHSKDVILLTERGLYSVIAKSTSKFSDKFMDFVSIVLEELRTKGVVTMTDAIKKFKDENITLNKLLDEKHAAYVSQQRDVERYYMQSYALADEKEKLKVENQLLKRQGKLDTQSQIMMNIKRKCMKRQFIKLEKPPKEVENEFDYKADEEEPNDDEEYVLSLHSKEPEVQGCETEIHVFKDCTQAIVQAFLEEKGLGIKKADGKFYHNKFRTTIELLCDAIDELNAKVD